MKVYAYLTDDAGDIIPKGQIGDWFDRFVYDSRHDEYRVQMPDGTVRHYVGIDLSSTVSRRTVALPPPTA